MCWGSVPEPKATLWEDKQAKEHEAVRNVFGVVLCHSILSFTVALRHG